MVMFHGRRGRRLTASERRRLDDLERVLAGEDPALANALRVGRLPRERLQLGLVGAAVGSSILIVLAAIVGGAGAAVATTIAVLATATTSKLLQRASPPGTAATPAMPSDESGNA